MEEDHYTVYCINLIHDRIDILDSSPDDHRLYHEVVGNRIIPRLNLLFQMATDYNIKQLSRFKRPILEVPAQLHDNDSGFFAIKFMELWNGESFHTPILSVSLAVLTPFLNVQLLSSPNLTSFHYQYRKIYLCTSRSCSSTAFTTQSMRL